MPVIERAVADRTEWLGWRKSNVNASEIACLFSDSVHPYMSAYKLWALKSGLLAEDPDTDEKRRGRLLEPFAVDMLRDERPSWQIWRPNVYLSDDEAAMGATPDVYAVRDGSQGLIQLKTAGKMAFSRNWLDPDTRDVETPLWIKVQTNVEAHLAGAEWAAVAVMTLGDGGVGFHIEEISLYPGLIANARELVDEFWRRVAERDPYPVDWSKDIDAVLGVYRDADGSTIDLSGDEDFARRLAERAVKKGVEAAGEAARKERRQIDAQIVARMGNAAHARVGPALVSATTVRKKAYTVAATSYRQIRIKGDVEERVADAAA